MKILLLGHNGLLGNDILLFNDLIKKYEILTINNEFRWPDNNFKEQITNIESDLILNCISTSKIDNTSIESIFYELPFFLSTLKNKFIINFSSDILNSNTVNKYFLVKKKAEKINKPGFFLNIRTSFFGISNKNSNLLYKYILNSSKISGFSNLYWSGVTTLEIYNSIDDFLFVLKKGRTKINFSSNCVSNYELLEMIKNIFNLNKPIEKIEHLSSSSRCSNSDIFVPDLNTQIKNLYNIYTIKNKII